MAMVGDPSSLSFLTFHPVSQNYVICRARGSASSLDTGNNKHRTEKIGRFGLSQFRSLSWISEDHEEDFMEERGVRGVSSRISNHSRD